MSSDYETTVTVGEEEQEVKILVRYTGYPFIRGARDGRYGPALEPDEPAHIEIEGLAEVVGGDADAPGIIAESDGKRYLDLSEDQEERLTEEIGQYLASMEAAAREDW